MNSGLTLDAADLATIVPYIQCMYTHIGTCIYVQKNPTYMIRETTMRNLLFDLLSGDISGHNTNRNCSSYSRDETISQVNG